MTSTMSDRASKPDVLEGKPDVLIQLVRLQLSSRDVYRDVEPVAELVPPRTLATCLLEHPPTDVDDHAGVFEYGDEGVRLDDAPLRMTPAKQRLDPGRLPAAEVEDRLVDEEVLVAGQSVAEVHFQQMVVLDRGVHLGSEHHVAILAGLFGPVEGDVGVAEQLGGRWSGARGDTDAGGQRQQSTG